VDRETVALARKKPTRNKKGTPVSKPEKPEAPRVRKTYGRRQKTEWSSPAHSAICDVDYDEVPPPTVQLSSLATNGRDLPAIEPVTAVPIPRALRMKGKNGKITPAEPPQMGTKPTAEVPGDKKCASIGKPKESDPCAQIQRPPTASMLEDDDPIQSFSSSPHSPSLVQVDMAKVISAFQIFLVACLFLKFSLHWTLQLQAMVMPPPGLCLKLSLVQSQLSQHPVQTRRWVCPFPEFPTNGVVSDIQPEERGKRKRVRQRYVED
jgi:hypothetical protein